MAGETEGATAEAKPEGAVSEEFAAEIKKAVEQELPAKKEEKEAEKETPAEETPKEGEEKTADEGEDKGDESEQEQQGEKSPDVEGEDASEAEARTDELLTRAVRAGIDLKDAKIFASQDEDALERQIGLLESKSQEAGKGGEEAAAGESAAADEDPLSGIPDLDPEIYDEGIVNVVQGLKSVIKEQQGTIKELKRTSGSEKSWFDAQVESLKVKDLPESKRVELNNQFDVLKAGYAAKGQQVDDKDVFNLASRAVLGEEMKDVKETDTKKKLEKRKQQQTARPDGPAVQPKGDPFEEAAQAVDQKFFGKK